MVDVMSAERAPAAAPPSRRWRAWATAVVGAVAVAALWWGNATDPLKPGSGLYAVASGVAPVASVNAPFGETAYVGSYVEGERVTLLFPLTNTGRAPVWVTEIFPAEDRLQCGWVPDRVETSVSMARDYRPFRAFWLSPGEIVDLSVSGGFDCEGRQGSQQGLASYDGVPVQWRLGGVVPRTTRVSTGYGFGWTEEPEQHLTGIVNRDASSKRR